MFVGIGATIIPDIEVGAGSIIGAGAAVVRDVSANVVVTGCPRKLLSASLR